MRRVFSIVLLSVLAGTVFGQDKELPHSIIYIVRTADFFTSACRSDIVFPNQRSFNLSLNSNVKYKIYSEGDIAVTVETFCSATQTATSSSRQVNLTVVRGGEYYLLYNGGKFTEVAKSDVQKYLDKQENAMSHEENLESPINRSSLKNIDKEEGQGQATCFLISSEGYFVTNYHCVEHAKEITIRGIEGDFTTKYGASVVAFDPGNDLALLKIGNKNVEFTELPISIRSSGVVQGEKVYALGYPAVESMGDEIKITEGIVSAKSGAKGDVSKFQISAAVNPGNSGGPLIDEDGNLLGIVYAKSTIADGAGYAIKIGYLEMFLNNVEGFILPELTNVIQDKPLPQKVETLKDFVFILEME